MSTTRQQKGGWSNRSAYPLMISQIVDRALVKMQAERNLSRGKALNTAIEEGLYALGYLTRPKTPEQVQKEAVEREVTWCRENWIQMSEKARVFWLAKYPELKELEALS